MHIFLAVVAAIVSISLGIYARPRGPLMRRANQWGGRSRPPQGFDDSDQQGN